MAAAIAAAAVLDNEATDARSYLPIRNENEGEQEGDSLRFALADPVHDPHAPSLSLSVFAANDRLIVPCGIDGTEGLGTTRLEHFIL